MRTRFAKILVGAIWTVLCLYWALGALVAYEKDHKTLDLVLVMCSVILAPVGVVLLLKAWSHNQLIRK